MDRPLPRMPRVYYDRPAFLRHLDVVAQLPIDSSMTIGAMRRGIVRAGLSWGRLGALALALGAGGCGGASPIAPTSSAAPVVTTPPVLQAAPPFSATGTWRGTVVYDTGSEVGSQLVSAQFNQNEASLTGTVVLAGITGRVEGIVAGQPSALSFAGTIQLEGSPGDPRVRCVSHPTAITGVLAPSIAWQSDIVTFMNCPGALRIHLELSQS